MNLDLNCDGFEKYICEHNPLYEGVQFIFKFDNNHGASVIKHNSSYGNKENLWELAVITFINKHDWHIDYTTEITQDVIGYLTDKKVLEILSQIRDLS